MDTDSAFLGANLEAPDDDTPRLIYADWLEERGGPRAELIRIQCALANLPACDPDKAALRVRARLCQRSRESLDLTGNPIGATRRSASLAHFGAVVKL